MSFRQWLIIAFFVLIVLFLIISTYDEWRWKR